MNEDKKKELENIKEEDINKEEINTKRLLDVLLVIIVIITVGCGMFIYYSIYKYNSEELANNNASQNVGTLVDMINTVIENSTNTQDENSVKPTGTTVTTEEADSRKVLNQEIIVLYDGLILDAKEPGLIGLKYIDNSNPLKEDYVITYYNYEHYTFKDSKLGVLSSQVIDGLVKIDNVGKVAVSESYNAIPRDIQVVNAIPKVVLDNNSEFSNYDSTKTLIVDLDNDGTNEYIVILANKTAGYSKIVLVESTGFIKAVLATMEKTGWESVSADGYYLSYNNVEILDIDNDGIMEILIEIPTKDVLPSQISVLKYKIGELSGKSDIACSLIK